MIKENFIGYTYLGDRESSQKPSTAGMVVPRLEVYTPQALNIRYPPDHNNQGTTFPVVVYHC